VGDGEIVQQIAIVTEECIAQLSEFGLSKHHIANSRYQLSAIAFVAWQLNVAYQALLLEQILAIHER
jgi:hypothetical protein